MKLNETKRNIDFKLLKLMHDKGFTVNETAEYFNCPIPTIQYYSRTRKMGRFKSFKCGWYDEQIYQMILSKEFTQGEIAAKLEIPQSFVSKRFKQLSDYYKKREERYEWLKKWESANDVKEN